MATNAACRAVITLFSWRSVAAPPWGVSRRKNIRLLVCAHKNNLVGASNLLEDFHVNSGFGFRQSAPSTIPLRLGFHPGDCRSAMNSQQEAMLAIEPAHLPHYTHSAVIVGGVIIVAIITLVAGVTLAIAHHLVSAGPMTHRDQSLQLHRIEKHEMIGAYLKLTEHAARSDLTVDVIPVPVSDVASPWDKQHAARQK